jgi:hypothetical protein
MDKEIELRDLEVPGYIRFSIRAPDTKDNAEVHNDFKEYARLYHRNDYTRALKELLLISKGSLWDEINKIRQKVDSGNKIENRGVF